MPPFDLPLDQLRNYTPDVAEPADFDEFWSATLKQAATHPVLGDVRPVHTDLPLLDTWDVTFAGFGGAFFAARQGMVNPESFTFIESALILAIVVLGGMGSQVGVILAAVLLTVLPELAREFAEYRMLMFGLVMVLMMMWRPQGLLPMKRPHVELSK